MKLKSFAVLLLSIGVCAYAWAGMDEGAAAYDAKNYAVALKEMRPLAEKGNMYAQYNLGVMYENGQGVAKDGKEAAKWYKKSAEQGGSFSQYNLGALYENGTGVAQNYSEALRWYRKAAAQNDPLALNNMGVLYRDGKGVLANKIVAFALWNYSAALDASPTNNAKKNRQALALQGMPIKDVELALSLGQELQQANGNLEVIDRYLTKLNK
ncbi:tetratricopeptide repeat protein [Undibacterium sp. Ren11W]|uniref:tetratricopeptide repeat protein n=1 Tax=Undibacterium sp. Ren11W TaxID=3413045 RepID=UPI003BF3D524